MSPKLGKKTAPMSGRFWSGCASECESMDLRYLVRCGSIADIKDAMMLRAVSDLFNADKLKAKDIDVRASVYVSIGRSSCTIY